MISIGFDGKLGERNPDPFLVELGNQSNTHSLGMHRWYAHSLKDNNLIYKFTFPMLRSW